MKKFKGILLLGIITIALLALTGCGATKVNLNKYVSITASGYDSMGAAKYTFNSDSFNKDYAKKIRMNSKSNDSLGIMTGMTPAELLLDICINQKLDQAKNLSNGDIVTLKWDCDDALAQEYFNVKLQYSDIEHKVSGLTKVAKLNPFDYVDVSFSGTSPYGNVTITQNYDQKEMQYVKFTADKSRILKNGDTIIITAYITEEVDTFVERFNCVLGETEKEYKVESLPYYITSVEEIPSDMMAQLTSKGEEVFRSDVQKNWAKPENLINVTYDGNYFLTLKPDKLGAYINYLHLIYKISALNPEPEQTVDYYYYLSYMNIMKLADGTCSIEFEKAPDNGWFSSESFTVGGYTYIGYQDLDAFANKHVIPNVSTHEFTRNSGE